MIKTGLEFGIGVPDVNGRFSRTDFEEGLHNYELLSELIGLICLYEKFYSECHRFEDIRKILEGFIREYKTAFTPKRV